MIEPISATAAAETAKTAALSTTKEALAESLKETAEEIAKESPVQSMMDTIENSSLETLEAQGIETINSSFEGTIHPDTGVPFEKKIIENIDGHKITGVFPNFKEVREFATKLPDNLLQETDKIQFDHCNEKLKDSYDKGTINADNFTERQLQQINNGDKPDGFTWHHTEDKGRMELVKSDIHQASAHTGGKSIWGGGKEAR
ncbi:MAG: hypothetical protein SCARUB_04039 [Candidatus Scalindua rubra]|uniref:HNH endonuclease n=1 Tax=Candidatus Scalindua rubra TaxID=1872076 RepID=A0A1E3X7A1_9BACT|nr:MAG: hypothetical protein SCARUB_04039 [Candidatus Scalindua rubra]